MPTYLRITDLPGGRTEEFAGSRGNYYVLDGGGQIDLHSQPVWCRACAGMTHGERIETVEDIVRQIAHLLDPTTLAHRMWTDSTHHEMFGGGDQMRRDDIEALRRRRR